MIHILVLEDDVKLNQVVCTYLNDSGFAAKGRLDATSAYDELYSRLYDLIISDIMMPGVDGFEFARTVRKINRHIPFCSCRRGTICPPSRRGSSLASTTTWSSPST